MKRNAKKALFLFVGLVLLVWLVWGIRLTGVVTPRSDTYTWGAFHIHSTYSDGLGDLESIAKAAKASEVDVVFLSDHGYPHRTASLIDDTIQGVRFIGGSEIGIPEGHLIATHPRSVPDYKLPPHPPEAISEVRAAGGLAVVTYPEDPKHGWDYWEFEEPPDALEIVNMTSYFRASHLGQKLKWASFYPFQPLVYLTAIEPPSFALQKWDAWLRHGPVHAIYSVNAHGGFSLTDETRISTPSYADTFRFAGLAFDKRYASDPEAALRSGNYFSAIRGAAEPERFEFFRESQSLHVSLEVAEYTPHIRLLRDGVRIQESEESFVVDEPEEGIYRVEVTLLDHPLLRRDVPWILSNAIVIGERQVSPKGQAFACESATPIRLDRFRLEKDAESDAVVSLEAPSPNGRDDAAPFLRLRYTLSEAEPDKIDRWIALALRETTPLAPYDAMRIRARSDRPMRLWVEFRGGTQSHYGSVRIPATSDPPETNLLDFTNSLDFEAFLHFENVFEMNGPRSGLPLAEAESLFLTLNSSNSYTNFSGELVFESIELCRTAEKR